MRDEQGREDAAKAAGASLATAFILTRHSIGGPEDGVEEARARFWKAPFACTDPDS